MSSSRWTSNLSEDDKVAFEKRLRGSKVVLRRLAVLTQEAYDVSDRIVHKRDFADASWSERTAYELGYQKALTSILELTKV